MTTTVPFMLTGQSLVDYVDEKMPLVQREELTRTDLIKDAGYVYDNGSAMYTQFYTELLNARGVTPATATDVEDAEYDNLDSDTKELYDSVDERLGSKWTHEEIIEFIEELDDIGITTAREFEDSFEYGTDAYHAESEFAEELCCEIEYNLKDSIVFAAINWQDVWDHQLRYDYSAIETSNGTFFFRNNWW